MHVSDARGGVILILHYCKQFLSTEPGLSYQQLKASLFHVAGMPL